MKEKTSKIMFWFEVVVGIATIVSCLFTVYTVFKAAEDIEIMVQQNTELHNDIENQINNKLINEMKILLEQEINNKLINEVKTLLKQEITTIITNKITASTQDKSAGFLQQTANPPQEICLSDVEEGEKSVAEEIEDIKKRYCSIFHNK